MISVLMSTYNGERYVAEQIFSIMKQTNVKVELLVRDDGSKDSTTDVVEHLSHEYPNIKLHKGQNVGFVDSFNELVRWAASECKADFYAFVDQDDVWYPNKLKIARERLTLFPKDEPNLFCSNSDIIDGYGQFTGKHFLQHVPRFTKVNILMYPTLQGCSMVFNRKALELYAEHLPQIAYHDRWMYYICNFMGNVYYEHQPLFGYRIHGHNALGVSNKKGLKTTLERARRMLTSDKTHAGYFDMTKEFYLAYSDVLPEKSNEIIRDYLSYRRDISKKIKLIFSNEFCTTKPGVGEQILRVIHILQNRI